jgi:hypothetical protein
MITPGFFGHAIESDWTESLAVGSLIVELGTSDTGGCSNRVAHFGHLTRLPANSGTLLKLAPQPGQLTLIMSNHPPGD